MMTRSTIHALIVATSVACSGRGAPSGPIGSDPGDPDPHDSAPPVDTASPSPRAPPVPADVLGATAAALRATFTAAARIERGPIDEVLRRVRTSDTGRCGTVTRDASGMISYTIDCDLPDDVQIIGQLRWFDDTITALDAPSAAWAATWAPEACPGVDPHAPLDPPAPRLFVAGQYTERAGQTLPVHLRGEFSDVQPGWAGCQATRTTADGYADVEGAPLNSWTGSDIEPQRVTVGRLRAEGGAALLTLDGTLGGIDGPFHTVDAAQGAWGGGCRREPRGAWGLRRDDGAWFDVTFDAVCDGCGVATAPGYAATPTCIPAEDAAAI
ncbi:MAG TPA: hypothetical protein PKA64_14940, partial [Myxococcota bacterium]|nr:hypothetical protein [Myxococcota bacterium]